MEIKLLQSFLTIADEGSITRAAEVLHITQPALSRQLMQLEQEVGCSLFQRGKRHMALTEEGLLLQRRAKEIVTLVSLTERELATQDNPMEGTISIGTGELASMATLARLIDEFHGLHPNVRFSLFTGVADQVAERLDRGILDFGLFLEPVDKEAYDLVAMPESEQWVALARADDPLAALEAVTPADLKGRSLILPSRASVRSELARWFGRGFDRLKQDFTVNLGGMAAVMVEQGLGVMLCVQGAAMSWDPARFAAIPLAPAIESRTLLAWKRDVAQTAAVNAFVEHVRSRL